MHTPNRHQGIRKIVPGGNLSTAGLTITEVTPRVTEWIPDLLEELLPRSIQSVRKFIRQEDPEVLTHARYNTVYRRLQEETLGFDHQEWCSTTDIWSDAEAEAVEYVESLVEFAVKYSDVDEDDLDELSEYHQQRCKSLKQTLTTISTGRGPLNAGLEALAKGPVRLHDELDDAPQPITLVLDGELWSKLDDRGTGIRALAAIAVLGSTFDVRLVISPALDAAIERRYPDWYDSHLRLTETRETSSVESAGGDGQPSAEQLEEAWEAIQNLPEESGRLRLLRNLPIEGSRDYRDLKQDDEIDVQAGTVGRYILDLEELGLVDIDRRGQYNSASLTGLGQVAVEQYVTTDYRVIHPTQSTLETHLTPTPQPQASTVYPARSDTREGDQPGTAEDWIAATGSPSEGADYVQWLDGPSGVLDAWGMHQRYLAGRRDRGVTLVDDRIERFEDGRVSYLSCFDDDLFVATQWGGPLPTLGRIAGTLLSDKALSKILTPSRLGNQFEEIDDAVVEQLDREAGEIIRRGHQIGWFSETEEDYDGWRERIGAVRSLCLQQVGELTNSDDVEARTELLRDLHGLVASATQLYHAADVDVTINVRVPDTGMLISDERRLDDFLGFARYTVPKQSVYGIHSGYRMLLEDRPEKLKRRLPYEVDDADSTMHLTASWVFSGPTMTDLHDDIEGAIEMETNEIREAIANGQESAPVMEIPVQIGNSYSAIRNLVEDYASAKNYQVAHQGDIHDGKQDIERLVRLFLRVLGTEERPHRACPHDVAEAMLHIAQSTRNYDFISVRDISYGLSNLPTKRLLPELPPTATKLLKTLLNADDPMGRSEIIDTADISESSYDRYINELSAWDIIEPREIEGHRRWEAHLEPWWTPQSDRDEPFADPDPDTGILYAEFPRDVASAVMCHLITHYDLPDLETAYLEGIQPGDDIKALFDDHDRLRRWRPFLWGAFADSDKLERGPSGTAASDSTVVRLGQSPGPDTAQSSFQDVSETATQRDRLSQPSPGLD
ncbi:plasmid replication protein RepH [Halobacterium salinarum]|uniref:plasmid replication protein RepH n=1 Tax=Halobacterium salinarum TaxID=2242 RepID=UPI002554D163|nr:plasmid replication protein RepH [Halobacterium salinarum]MDL0133440.1 plasmid replication protein RepH [Halobacterium salinarum]